MILALVLAHRQNLQLVIMILALAHRQNLQLVMMILALAHRRNLNLPRGLKPRVSVSWVFTFVCVVCVFFFYRGCTACGSVCAGLVLKGLVVLQIGWVLATTLLVPG